VKRIRRLVNLLSFALIATSIATELSKPPGQRTWCGELFGIFPYDWRIPTLGRVRSTVWDRNNPRLLVPTVFGVGWTINLYPLFHTLIGV